MSGSEFIVEPDRWSLPRRPISTVRGPLRVLPRRRAMPLWPLGLGLAGLSLAVAFALPPRPAPAPAEPAPPVLAELTPTPRVVGAAEVPVPGAASSVAVPPAAEAPTAEPTAQPTPATTPARAAVPALDVGQLPMLQLDAAAFDAAPTAEAAPRPPAKPPARHTAPRIAGQP